MENKPTREKLRKTDSSKDRALLDWVRRCLKGQWWNIIAQIILKSASAVSGVCLALAIRAAIDAAVAKQSDALWQGLALMLGLIALQSILGYISSRVEATTNIRVSTNLKRRVMHTLFGKSYPDVTAHHTGELLNRVVTDADTVTGTATAMLPNVVAMLLRIVTVGILLAVMSWQLLCVACACGIAAAAGALLFRGRMKRLQRDVRQKEGKVRAFMQESLGALAVIKAFRAADLFTAQLQKEQDESIRARLRQQRFSVLAGTLVRFAFSCGYMIALGFCAFRLINDPLFTYGTLTAILQLTNQIRSPIAGMGSVIPSYYNMLVSAERLIELESLPDEAETPDAPLTDFAAIVGEDLSFAYTEDAPVLSDLQFTLEKGDLLAVTGRSGIGKSTLMKLLLALYAPTGGVLSVQSADGQTQALSAAARPLFAYVPQGNLLFSGTVRENLGMFAENIDDAEIWNALTVACAADFIRERAEQLDAPLKEGGAGLSEGQAQRIAVARALLTAAPILLLDEATSALDERTERAMLENIRATGRTCVLISHRPKAAEIATKTLDLMAPIAIQM
ncbi:MAG: ABC transporter ATP-binding protein/permease [Clostridiales bacterium]|nr:ABC transporter ATP-binding protein/permease [Clostridiales bacterium]